MTVFMAQDRYNACMIVAALWIAASIGNLGRSVLGQMWIQPITVAAAVT